MDVFEGITIDPPGSRDLDDGFHVAEVDGGWRVAVAVPRLTDVVPPGGALDLAARRRGSTRYLAGRPPVGMLPDEVTARLSLTAEAPKDALVLRLELDADLAVVDARVSRAAFVNVARLTYPEAGEAAASATPEVRSALSAARRLSRALERRRAASGSLAFRDLGRGMATDEEGHAVPSTWGGHWAEAAVRELMILSNATLASLCARRDLPILFRNHRARGVANLPALLEDLDMARSGLMSLDALAGRLSLVVGRATLAPTVEGHWGLGLPAYAWFTSPIRRYADLANQRNLEAALEGRDPPHDADALAALGAELDELALAAAQGRSESLKAEALRGGEDAIRRGRVSEVDATAFGQVVKAATAGDRLDAEVLREASARLARGELTVKDMARLLASGVPGAVRPVLDHVVANPALAVSLADHAARSSGWSAVAYEERATGPSHARSFRVVARIEAGGRSFASPPCVASSARDARQAACARAVAALHGVEVPPPAVGPAAAAPAARPAGTSNGKGRLLEFCQARHLDQPTYEVRSSGPSHAPTFTAVARVTPKGGPRQSEPRTAPTARGAEAAAALDLLGRLVGAP